MSTNGRHRQQRSARRKAVLAVGALAASGVIIVGAGQAFFNDSVELGGGANAGTLALTGTMAVSHTSGTTVDRFVTTGMTGTNVDVFNPGDVLKVAGTITNTGNTSAWIRAAVDVTSVDAAIGKDLYVYAGESVPTQAQLLAADTPSALAQLPGYVDTAGDIAAGAAPATSASAVKVVGGNPAATAPEADSTTASGTNTYGATVVVYFDKAAGNDDQDESVALDVLVQAVQFHNHVTAPTDSEWAAVQQTPAGA
jgi:hypothetical protein